MSSLTEEEMDFLSRGVTDPELIRSDFYRMLTREKIKSLKRKRILPEYDEGEVNKGIDDAIKAEQE